MFGGEQQSLEPWRAPAPAGAAAADPGSAEGTLRCKPCSSTVLVSVGLLLGAVAGGNMNTFEE